MRAVKTVARGVGLCSQALGRFPGVGESGVQQAGTGPLPHLCLGQSSFYLSVLWAECSCRISFEAMRMTRLPWTVNALCLDLSSFCLPVTQRGKDPTRRPRCLQHPSTVCVACVDPPQHTPSLPAPHTRLQQVTLLGFHAITLKGPLSGDCLRHLCVLFSASALLLELKCHLTRDASLTSSARVSPTETHPPLSHLRPARLHAQCAEVDPAGLG